MKSAAIILTALLLCQSIAAQTDATTPLHLLKPDYPMPYGIPKPEEVAAVLKRMNSASARLTRR